MNGKELLTRKHAAIHDTAAHRLSDPDDGVKSGWLVEFGRATGRALATIAGRQDRHARLVVIKAEARRRRGLGQTAAQVNRWVRRQLARMEGQATETTATGTGGAH